MRIFVIAGEFVSRDIEIARGGPLPDASGRVVDRTMAGAEPAVIWTLAAERNAAEMRADADHDQPFRFLDARLVRGRIGKL